MELNLEECIKYLLFAEYKREWEIIDGLYRHKDQLSFDEWLKEKKLTRNEIKFITITKEDLM